MMLSFGGGGKLVRVIAPAEFVEPIPRGRRDDDFDRVAPQCKPVCCSIGGGLSGEVDIVPQLLMEMVDHIRAGKMNALAVLMDQPFKLSGAPDIPAISATVPGIKPYLPMGESFGIILIDTPPLGSVADSRGRSWLICWSQ